MKGWGVNASAARAQRWQSLMSQSPTWRMWRSGLRRWVVSVLCILSLFTGLAAQAQTPQASIERIEPILWKKYLALDIDAELTLGSAMRDALDRGVPLTFLVSVEIGEPRWWWFDRMLVEAQLRRRIAFNTLTRQWRVSIGDLGVTVPSFDEAMRLLRHVRGWEVSPTDRFATGKTYEGRVRIELDMSQVSRALQLDAGKRDWSLQSPWSTFQFQMTRDESKLSEGAQPAENPSEETQP